MLIEYINLDSLIILKNITIVNNINGDKIENIQKYPKPDKIFESNHFLLNNVTGDLY